MAINFARGLDELGEGLLRQADIGGRAYEGAMVKEGETRAENRLLAAEGRATKRQQDAWAREERLLLDAQDRQERLLTEERTYEDRIFGERLKLTQESDMQAWIKKNAMTNQAAFKLQRQQNLFDLRKQIDAAEGTAQVEMLKIRAQRMGELSDQIESIWEHRPDNAKWNPDSLKWDDDGVWKDELEAARRKYNKAASGVGLEPLTENADGVKYGKDARTIFTSMQQARGGAETEAWEDLMKGLIAKKDSDSYKSTVETLNEAIDKYVKDPNNAYTQFTGAELHKLKKEVLEFFKYKAYGFDARDDGDGVVVDPDVDPTTLPEADPTKTGLTGIFLEDPAYIVKKMEEVDDLSAVLEVGALARAEAIPRPARPTRIDLRQRAINGAKRKDPAYLLKILMDARAKPAYSAWYSRMDELIRKLQAILGEDTASLSAPRGMLNQPGMLQMFNSGQELDYSAEAVRARTEGLARPEEVV
jgi:hypothetical protein